MPILTMDKSKLKIVYLEWEDHQSHIGWADRDDDTEPCKCYSVGILVKEDNHSIVISNSQSDDNQFIDPMTIIKSTITRRRNINISKLVSNKKKGAKK